MRICRKCNKRVDVAGKICRACGAILVEVPDGQFLAEAGQVVDADMPSVPAPSGTGSPEPVAKPAAVVAEEGKSPKQELAGADWKCQHCGETIPGNFDVCWKCLATKAGEPEPNAAQLLSEVGENSQEREPGDSPLEAEVVEGTDQEVATQDGCPRCGSTKLIRDVTVADQGESSDGKLKAVVFGNPQALIFKNRLYGEIRADICGRCGHIELRVANPGQLYSHYQKSRGLDRQFDPKAFSASSCMKCGMLVVKGSPVCPHCGASPPGL